MVHDSMTDAPRRSAGQEYEVPQPLARLMAALEESTKAKGGVL